MRTTGPSSSFERPFSGPRSTSKRCRWTASREPAWAGWTCEPARKRVMVSSSIASAMYRMDFGGYRISDFPGNGALDAGFRAGAMCLELSKRL